MNTKKIISILGVTTGIIAAACFIFLSSPILQKTHAQTAVPVPNLGFNSGSANYSVYLSSSGPFTEDFKIEVCITGANDGWGPSCVTSPWASQSAGSGGTWVTSVTGNGSYYFTHVGTSSVWTYPGHGDELGVQNHPPVSMSASIVATQPLPAGKVLNNVQLGIEIVEDNGGVLNGSPSNFADYFGNSNVASYGSVFTPIGGGWSYNAAAYNRSNADNSFSPDEFAIALVGGMYDAAGVSNNIPTTFNVSENKTIGSDGQPLEITVQNTGNAPWISDQSTPIAGSQSGTCNGAGGTQPLNSDPQGTSCTFSANNYSTLFELQHVSGSFGVGSNPAQYSQVTKNTCTVGAPACNNPSPSCSSQQSCESVYGYCSINNAGSNTQQGCMQYGGTWMPGCDSTWAPQIKCSVVSGDPNIEPGATTVFKIGSLTAPAKAGSYTETWQMQGSGGTGNFGLQIPINIQAGSSAGGTINVASENSVTHQPVAASWAFLSGPATPSSQNVTQATYTNMPLPGSYVICHDFINCPTTTESGYVFNSIQQIPIAQNHPLNWFYALGAFTKNIFSPDALAGSISPAWSQSLLVKIPTNNYTILWDPVAAMTISPSAWNPSAASGGSSVTQSVTITNSGKSGSTLTWTAVTSTSPGDPAWLSISSPSGSAPDTVTITANPSVPGLRVGQHIGTIKFKGNSTPGSGASEPSGSLTVTFNVTKAGVTATVTSVTVSCSLSTIYTKGTSVCTATVSGTGGFNSAVNWSSNVSPTGKDTATYTASNTPGSATITATSVANPSESGTATITVNTPPLPTCAAGDASCQVTCNSPSLTASPASIVVPESSNLSYGCTNVTECQLSGGSLNPSSNTITRSSPGTISGTATTTPSVTTTYTLTCKNGATSNPPTSYTTQVTVGGSSYCEQNPNGVGCQ